MGSSVGGQGCRVDLGAFRTTQLATGASYSRTSEVFSKNEVSLESEVVSNNQLLVTGPLSPTALQCPSGAAGRQTSDLSTIDCTNKRRYNRMVEQA